VDIWRVSHVCAPFSRLDANCLLRLQRGADGKFDDGDLASIIYAAINTPAHAFGARSTPAAMRVVEIMTIEQNRAWGTCTLNEFRKFFGLKPLESFVEWNPDPAVHEPAQVRSTCATVYPALMSFAGALWPHRPPRAAHWPPSGGGEASDARCRSLSWLYCLSSHPCRW
jgi:hypothetical protein